MRWMIGMLLVANLIVFLWWNTGQERVSARASAPKPDVGTLQLLSEVSVGSAADNPSAAKVKEAPGGPRQAIAAGRKQGLANAEDSGKPPVRPAKAPEPQKQLPVTVPTSPSQPPKRPVVESAQQPVVESAQQPVVESAQPVVEPSVPEIPKVEQEVEQACWELGPFEDTAQLQTLRLPKEVERLEVRHSPIRVPSGFYVLIPAQKDRKSARALVRRLKEKGVQDFWLFNSGPLKNAISLGMFNREKNAQQRRDEVAKLGFAAEVHARHRTLEGTLLHLRGPKSAAIERQLRSISAGQMRRIACPPAESP